MQIKIKYKLKTYPFVEVLYICFQTVCWQINNYIARLLIAVFMSYLTLNFIKAQIRSIVK